MHLVRPASSSNPVTCIGELWAIQESVALASKAARRALRLLETQLREAFQKVLWTSGFQTWPRGSQALSVPVNLDTSVHPAQIMIIP